MSTGVFSLAFHDLFAGPGLGNLFENIGSVGTDGLGKGRGIEFWIETGARFEGWEGVDLSANLGLADHWMGRCVHFGDGEGCCHGQG